ncbi:MAG: succinate dehydrogenase cytochrome b subunit [Acidobacteria bacterium]|nr:succinate dehydrogenase cytochrome b subunit [Acidobacteriota bacterium]
MSTAVMNLNSNRAARFYDATIGKKAVMAVSGVVLFGFLIGHLVGNLQIYAGPDKVNHYARFLHSMPGPLWGARMVLLLAVVLHMWSAFQLWLLKREARPVAYRKKSNPSSSYASRTMIWSGPIIGAFVVYHLLHFTFGTVLPGGLARLENGDIDVYQNLITGFSQPLVSLFYVIAVVLLGVHLYHGLWSMFQSLGVSHPRYTPRFKQFAAAASILIAAGNISIPLSVLAGFVK